MNRRHKFPSAEEHAPIQAKTHLLPTLLDRLLDDNPSAKTELPKDYAVTQKRMREIVQRDLAWLLNTTSLEDEINRVLYPAAASSVVNYGVPAFAGSYVSERSWADIELIIRRAIHDFEPRLDSKRLRVVPLVEAGSGPLYNILYFEIRGVLHMQPYPVEFMVQSSLDLETSRLTFK